MVEVNLEVVLGQPTNHESDVGRICGILFHCFRAGRVDVFVAQLFSLVRTRIKGCRTGTA